MNSTFVNLTDYCILEFNLTPISEPSPTLTDSQFYFLKNNNVNGYQIYNTDGYLSKTNNIRSFSTISIGGSSVIWNDPTLSPIYSQYDSNVTETLLSATLSQNMVFDTMRIHLASGFDFSEVENLIVGANYKMNNEKTVQISTILLNSTSVLDLYQYNPRPLFIANTIYDKYIDIKIPSAPWINKDFDDFGISSFVYAITEGVGFIKDSPITVFLAEANLEEYNAPNDITYDRYKIINYYEGSVSQINKFDALGCIISEASDGDYIQFHATWGGAFPDSLVSSLNEQGPNNNWIFTHQLQVYEQVGSSFYKTGNLTIYQEDNFDEILTYRPILKDAGFAISMSIDYTLRLINTLTGDQIIKTASLSILNPNKYGKKLAKIKLASSPQSMKVYNKIVQRNFELGNLFSPKSTQTNIKPVPPKPIIEYVKGETVKIREYIPIKQLDILLSYQNALSSVRNERDKIIYGQGDLVLPIDPTDNFIRFTAYEINPKTESEQKRMNLNLNSTFKLNFGKTSEYSYESLANSTLASPSKGEFLFKIPKDEALQILKMTDPQFFISLVSNTDNSETLFYTGTWISSLNYSKITKEANKAKIDATKDKTIAELSNKLKETSNQLDGLKAKEQTLPSNPGLNNPDSRSVSQRKTEPKVINGTIAKEIPTSQQTNDS